MSTWLRWSSQNMEGLLAAYVQRDAVRRMFPGRIPPAGSGKRLDRAKAVYEAFVRQNIRYAYEDPASGADGQVIRPPDEVLLHHRYATCLDIAVTFAGACLDAGLHPMIVITGAGGARHALVVVWLAGDLEDPPHLDYPLYEAVHRQAPPLLVGDLYEGEGSTGSFAAIDVTGAAHGYTSDGEPLPWAEALAAGARLAHGDWTLGVDIGLAPRDRLPMPEWPEQEPLTRPYHLRDSTRGGPLAELQARRGRVKFAARDDLDLLIDWCDSTDPADQTKVTIIHGVGGAGKTRLAAELAERMAAQGWYTGFLVRRPSSTQLSWLGRLTSPLLVVVDYAEAAKTDEILDLMRAVRGRSAPTCVVLTARIIGDWWADVARGTRDDGHEPAVLEHLLEPVHPAGWRVFRLAGRAFAGGDVELTLPDTPRPIRWTTLDLILLAWLAADGISELPTGHDELYEKVLDREFAYWQETYKELHGGKAPTKRTLRALGASLALLSPREERLPKVISSVLGITGREERDRYLELVTGMLPTEPGDGSLSLRPDPVGGHLLVHDLPRDTELLESCLDIGEDTELENACEAISRARQNDDNGARNLAVTALARQPDLWRYAFSITFAQGGPFVPALEGLARQTNTPLPLAELAEVIPLGHSALSELARIAAERQIPTETTDDEESLNARAAALNNLSNQQANTGDHTAALESIQETVTIRRDLAHANPAAYLPDLAGSLNNFINCLYELNDRSEANEAFLSVLAPLSPGPQAECLVVIARRQAEDDSWHSFWETVHNAIRLADEEKIPYLRGRARRAVGAMVRELGNETETPLPGWVLRSLDDEETNLLNAWLSATEWPKQAAFLRAEHDRLLSQEGGSLLSAARDLYPELDGLERLAALLDSIRTDGLDPVLAQLDTAHAHIDLVQRWLATPTWTESRAFLRTHRRDLARPETVALLLPHSEDEQIAQHLAILALLERLDLDDVYDAITDVTVAADQAMAFLEAGDLEALDTLWTAAPSLRGTEFVAPFLVAVMVVLSDAPPEEADPRDLMRIAAEQATSTQRRAGATRLRRLSRHRPELQSRLTPLIDLLSADPPPAAP